MVRNKYLARNAQVEKRVRQKTTQVLDCVYRGYLPGGDFHWCRFRIPPEAVSLLAVEVPDPLDLGGPEQI